MIRLFRAASMLLVVTIGGCMSAPVHQSRSGEDAPEIGKKMIQTLAAAMEAGDASAVAALFTEDGVLLPSQEPEYRGRQAIRNFYEAQFKEYVIHVDAVVLETRTFGDHGYSRGTYTAKVTPKNGGAPIVGGGRYLTLIQRQPDGTWKATREMSNSDHP